MLGKIAVVLMALISIMPANWAQSKNVDLPYRAFELQAGPVPAACNQASALRCQDDAAKCLASCQEPGALAARCREECSWKLRSCRTMAGC